MWDTPDGQGVKAFYTEETDENNFNEDSGYCLSARPVMFSTTKNQYVNRAIMNRLRPELIPVPIDARLSFDFDVAFNLRLARESHFIFVSDACEKRQRHEDSSQSKLLPDAWLAAVFLALGDVDTASGAKPETRTVYVLMDSRIDLDTILHGLFAKVGSLLDLDRFLFFCEFDCGHVQSVSIL